MISSGSLAKFRIIIILYNNNRITLIETRKSRDIQSDNEYKNINIEKIYHINYNFLL